MRYIIGLLAIIVLIVFGIVIFTGDGNDEPVTEQGIVLNEYADTDASVTLVIDGPIIASEEHRTVRITVSRGQRLIEVLKGYDGQVIRSKTFNNTEASYESFLYALGNVGFTKSRKPSQDSYRSVCPDSNRYVYEINENGENKQQLWSADCRRNYGSLAGEEDDIINLFEAQIPGYRELTQDVDLT